MSELNKLKQLLEQEKAYNKALQLEYDELLNDYTMLLQEELAVVEIKLSNNELHWFVIWRTN